MLLTILRLASWRQQEKYLGSLSFLFGLCPEVELREKNLNFFYLNCYKSFKTEYIYKNQLWTIWTYIGLWFEGKKNGVIKGPFLQPPGIVTWKSEIYSRISPRKWNIFQKYFVVLHRGLCTIDSCKKTRHQKSHATVPFKYTVVI